MKRIVNMCVILVAASMTSAQAGDPAPATPAPASTAPTTQPISASLGAVVYPANKQTPQQQSVDEQECYNWAKGQLGYDPLAPAPAQQASTAPPPPAQTGPTGARVRGAARGAAAGAVIGEVANNDADEGAKVGAAAGAIAGGRQARQQKAAQQQQAEAQAQQQQANAQAEQAQKVANFKKAFNTCLQGRGYTAS
jgi:hypothetical protein